jgi:predicted DNA-binding ribbon-helix-helix protein
MVSTLVNRNVTVAGHRTSMRLEPSMWEALEEICRREGRTVHQVCTEVWMHGGTNRP